MASQFSRECLKIVVGKICLAMGWHSIHTTPLNILVDLLDKYILDLGKTSQSYAEHFGHTEPNLDEIGLAFRDAGIRVEDLSEYIQNVESVPFPHAVSRYPVKRESHLNFLKPGSREVLTRQVHVHEHLPPMYPDMEEEDLQPSTTSVADNSTTTNTGGVSAPASPKGGTFKRPGEPPEPYSAKRARLMLEEEGRPLREISSVMMTTSGFLSPAREGKLPEARTPNQPSDSTSRSSSPITSPSSYPMVPPEVKGEKKVKKLIPKRPLDGIKKIERDDPKRKDNKPKDIRGVGEETKKLVSMKEFTKLKALKQASKMMAQAGIPQGPSISGLGKIPKIGSKVGENKMVKHIKNIKPHFPHTERANFVDGKLSSEPDKQKLNIFKKISKVKEEKPDRLDALELSMKDSRESSPGLIIDEPELKSRDIRMAQIDTCIDSVIQQSAAESVLSNADASFEVNVEDSDSYSSPPVTPDIPSTSGKTIRRDKPRRDKKKRMKSGDEEPIPDRPRTPDVPDIRPQVFSFFTHLPAPGLIQPPLRHPYYPRFPLMGKNLPSYPPMANLPLPPVLFNPRVEEPPLPPPPPVKEKTPPPVTPPPPVKEKTPPPTPSPASVTSPAKERSPEKKQKEHKKEKRDKDKTKKKKDKKDKLKGKERSEKKKIKEEKRDKLKSKEKKEKKEKRKEKEREEKMEGSVPKITFRLGPSTVRPVTPDILPPPLCKITIKPIVKTPEELSESSSPWNRREPSPELARMTALITRPPKKPASKQEVEPPPLPPPPPPPPLSPSSKKRPDTKPKTSSPPGEESKELLSYYHDGTGNKVWICPACRGQDDGSPMIGCDDCDAWYHWVCVGIQVPPDENEDWYCRVCIVKKQEHISEKSKKKRKKRIQSP